MLVLSATYGSELFELVDRTIFPHLLTQTISVLKRYQNVSPTLCAASRTLEGIYQGLFGSQSPRQVPIFNPSRSLVN